MMDDKGKPGSGCESPGDRKDKVLQTRIPRVLDQEIKKRARNLGTSVSTVVRNVLLHTFDLVDDIVTDSTNIALSLAGEETHNDRRRAEPEADPAVLGWQEAILNLNAVCSHCNAILAKGTTAAIGIPEAPGPRTIICITCLATIRARSGDDGA